MTTLYRSPNVLIDGVVWHVAVIRNGNRRVNVQYRWRRSEREMWQSVAAWPGSLPKGLRNRFGTYRKSVLAAVRFEAEQGREAA